MAAQRAGERDWLLETLRKGSGRHSSEVSLWNLEPRESDVGAEVSFRRPLVSLASRRRRGLFAALDRAFVQ